VCSGKASVVACAAVGGLWGRGSGLLDGASRGGVRQGRLRRPLRGSSTLDPHPHDQERRSYPGAAHPSGHTPGVNPAGRRGVARFGGPGAGNARDSGGWAVRSACWSQPGNRGGLETSSGVLRQEITCPRTPVPVPAPATRPRIPGYGPNRSPTGQSTKRRDSLAACVTADVLQHASEHKTRQPPPTQPETQTRPAHLAAITRNGLRWRAPSAKPPAPAPAIHLSTGPHRIHPRTATTPVSCSGIAAPFPGRGGVGQGSKIREADAEGALDARHHDQHHPAARSRAPTVLPPQHTSPHSPYPSPRHHSRLSLEHA
jgi:hypothetical protein